MIWRRALCWSYVCSLLLFQFNATVTNSVLSLFTLSVSLLLIFLFCICKYLSILSFKSLFQKFFKIKSSRSRGFLRKANNCFYLDMTSLPPSGCASVPLYSTSPSILPSCLPPLPQSHTLWCVFLPHQQPALMRWEVEHDAATPTC